LPFGNNCFDGVFTLETLVHANPVEQVLAEFWRVLRPGGKLVLFEYSIPNLKKIVWPVRRMAQKVIKRTVMTSLPEFTHGAFLQILIETGYVDIKSRDISKNVWPTWYFLWLDALKKMGEMARNNTLRLNTIPGTAMIYLARRHLGYVVSEGCKPDPIS
jgi:sterol 24-C-methyltransferase